MNTFTARHGLTKIKLALAAMALACLALAFTANGAKAAQGDPFAVDFNYAALTTGAAGEAIDSLILKPSDGLGELETRGTYTDNSGNFTLPKETGLTFPPISINIGDVATVNGSIALLEDGTGNYNATTGELSMHTKINLTLGVNDIQALAEETGFPIQGEGPLTCAIGPLDLALSTGGQWPHAAKVFGNPAALQDGSVAGYWDYKPDATSVGDDSKQYLCDLIGGLLDPVGGLWLANGTLDTYTEDTMPAATIDKPVPPICGANEVGIYPNCEPATRILGSLKLAPKNVKVKAGKKGKLKVTVKNTGNSPLTVKVKLKSSNRQVKVAKTVKITLDGGTSVTRNVTVKTTKKAKGKAKITATANGKKATSTVKVQKAKKKKKKKKSKKRR